MLRCMEIFIIVYPIWAAAIVLAWPLSVWISKGLMSRFPKLRELLWGYQMLPLAFALSPMVTGFWDGDMVVFPAALGIVVGLLNPSGLPSAIQELVNYSLVSFLITWGVLWGARCVIGWIKECWQNEEESGENSK